MSTDAYPLNWPAGYPRTPSHERERGKFSRKVQRQSTFTNSSYSVNEPLTISIALRRLEEELGRFGGETYYIVSTNVPTRKDGLPYSNAKEPEDPGVAVYFEIKSRPLVMCCDKWTRVADNIAAIAASIEALRGLKRWGMSQADRAFTGFEALPAPGETQAQTCWEVLEMKATTDAKTIKTRFHQLARDRHPDYGGNDATWAPLQTAYEQAMAQAQ